MVNSHPFALFFFSDIKERADICEACQEMKPRNPPEPLKQHSDGDEPGQKTGLDFFEIAGKHEFDSGKLILQPYRD